MTTGTGRRNLLCELGKSLNNTRVQQEHLLAIYVVTLARKLKGDSWWAFTQSTAVVTLSLAWIGRWPCDVECLRRMAYPVRRL